jgi:hypothetical protein
VIGHDRPHGTSALPDREPDSVSIEDPQTLRKVRLLRAERRTLGGRTIDRRTRSARLWRHSATGRQLDDLASETEGHTLAGDLAVLRGLRNRFARSARLVAGA